MSRSCFWSAGKLVSRIGFDFRKHCYAGLQYQYFIAHVFNCNLKKRSPLNTLLLKMAQCFMKFSAGTLLLLDESFSHFGAHCLRERYYN